MFWKSTNEFENSKLNKFLKIDDDRWRVSTSITIRSLKTGSTNDETKKLSCNKIKKAKMYVNY